MYLIPSWDACSMNYAIVDISESSSQHLDIRSSIALVGRPTFVPSFSAPPPGALFSFVPLHNSLQQWTHGLLGPWIVKGFGRGKPSLPSRHVPTEYPSNHDGRGREKSSTLLQVTTDSHFSHCFLRFLGHWMYVA